MFLNLISLRKEFIDIFYITNVSIGFFYDFTISSQVIQEDRSSVYIKHLTRVTSARNVHTLPKFIVHLTVWQTLLLDTHNLRVQLGRSYNNQELVIVYQDA